MGGRRRMHGDGATRCPATRYAAGSSARRAERRRQAGRRRRRRAYRRRRATGAGRPRTGDGWAGPGRRPPAPARPLEVARQREPLAAWRSMRTCSVSMPRSTRNAENGAMPPPVSICTARTLRRSARRCPATTPPITSEWPPSHFVADSTTRSAPSSSGRHRYGEAKVLSTQHDQLGRWPRAARSAMSLTTMVGLAIVSR